MSHTPPVPAGNQSPYPLQEPPHKYDAEPPAGAPVAKTPDRGKKADKPDKPGKRGKDAALSRGVIGALAAAGVAAFAAAGTWAYVSRSHETGGKKRKGKRAKH